MIQRIQSVWLLLAAVFSLIELKLSFFSGNKLNPSNNLKEWIEFTAQENTLLLVTTVSVAVAALVTLFMFKDRKRQLLITLGITVLAIVNIVLYFNAKSNFEEAKLDLGSLIGFAIPILLLLATRGIYKDEQLVKSTDRLR
jgi:peptidoglycan/LPS O-acetylase OafA/YrhL